MFYLLSIYIYLVSCGPGSHVYSQYGHTAIEVVDTERHTDRCYNFGYFSFNSGHFYLNFIRGYTYYELVVEDAFEFYRDCRQDKREVFRQELNLSEAQKSELVRALVINARPENRTYLYNFVYDNCATRPYQLIKKAVGDSILSSYAGHEGETYRRFLQRYARRGTWSDLGINLIFGKRADEPMKGEERLFIPEELMLFISQAYTREGGPLVKRQNVRPFTPIVDPWYAHWYPALALYVILLLGITLRDRKRRKLSWGIDCTIGGLYLCLVLLVIYLRFFSIHPLVGFSWRLMVFPMIHLCVRFIYRVR